jgi:predicted P-loop ATPase
MQRNGQPSLGRETTQQAVEQTAGGLGFHPVRDYLNGLRWDGVKRLDCWLSGYLGADPSPYVAGIGRLFLIAMVARIYEPGCKADYMLVLEDEQQGTGKSTACSILAGGWFSDSLPELYHGDPVRLSMHLRGKWLIEISELSAIGRAEAGALKAFLTQADERYTPKYGRNEVIEPRQCSFIGTTNKTVYLRDETGGRRFWPVKTGKIDLAALSRDRDQLFAEAMAAYGDGEVWSPDRDFEAKHIRCEQEARFEADAWETLIADWIAGGIPDGSQASGVSAHGKLTVAEVASGALLFDPSRLGTADQRRIAAVLERLGWMRGARGANGERFWVRRPPV